MLTWAAWLVSAALVLPGPALALAAPARQVPRAIASNCSVDVTRALNTWVAGVPDGSTIEFGRGACYRIDGTLELVHRHRLRLDGNGAAFVAGATGDPWRSQWRLVGGAHLVLRDMMIRGANAAGGTFTAALQHQHAVELDGVRAVRLDHVHASHLYGDCIYVGRIPHADGAWSRDVRVSGLRCTGNGRMGIAVVAGRNIVVEHSRFERIALTAFDIEPNGPGFGARDVSFVRNRAFGPLRAGFFTAVGDGPVDRVTVADNRLSGAGMYMAVLAPRGERRSGIMISRNVASVGYSAPGGAALDFERVDRLAVIGNVIPLGAAGMALASIRDSCGVRIYGNRFSRGAAEARISGHVCR